MSTRSALKQISSSKLNAQRNKMDLGSKMKKPQSKIRTPNKIGSSNIQDYVKKQPTPATNNLKRLGGIFDQAPKRVPVNQSTNHSLSISSSSSTTQPFSNQNTPEQHHSNGFFEQYNIFTVNNTPYLVLKKIGKGGSSKVYKVMAPDSNIYALKRVNINNINPQALESFVNEIALLKKLKEYHSDRIISMIDSEVDNTRGVISIVLELGDIDLRSLIEKNLAEKEEIDPNFLRLMWQQMLEAVQVVHHANVVHGDLKPANFLFVKGTLKLIDFGIAKRIAVENDTTNIERSNQVGTLNYMPPESLKLNETSQKFKVGTSGDVWSLGCILYQLVYGRPPFPQTDWLQKIQAIVDDAYEIEFPEIIDRFDFPDLLQTMKSCLQRNPKLRPKISDLLNHPYLTFKPTRQLNNEELEKDILLLINFIQEDYQDVPLESKEMSVLIKGIASNFDNYGRLWRSSQMKVLY
ncbi:Pkinase-domain-containing protein [Histomonas meleagridis]|uniref:Pkinase-domain-containing protein n=1 Tax=Histomonas meleagridis TaxID=135588 RepID=UPI003559B316|nr:Pkinase-domain-containing protein [Histomonas meleagridis]KAH0796218.1 Pkinase-domain-containing protein [Histomonas meleagridis]